MSAEPALPLPGAKLSGMAALLEIVSERPMRAPVLVAAFDGWVDAGSASTQAAAHLAGEGELIARLDPDVLYDFRSRRPVLDIVDGRLLELTWPELVVRRAPIDERDVVVLAGAEPDYRWPALADAILELCVRLGLQVGNVNGLCRIRDLTEDSGKGLTDDLLAQMVATCPVGYRPDVLFMSRRSRRQLQQSRTATNATGAPAPTPIDHDGIPIVATDSITDTEALSA